MINETGFEAIPIKCILPKFLHLSPIDYCAFELLKRALFKRHHKFFLSIPTNVLYTVYSFRIIRQKLQNTVTSFITDEIISNVNFQDE